LAAPVDDDLANPPGDLDFEIDPRLFNPSANFRKLLLDFLQFDLDGSPLLEHPVQLIGDLLTGLGQPIGFEHSGTFARW